MYLECFLKTPPENYESLKNIPQDQITIIQQQYQTLIEDIKKTKNVFTILDQTMDQLIKNDKQMKPRENHLGSVNRR